MRKTIIAGNWKMNMNLPEAEALASGIMCECLHVQDVEIVIAPPFTALIPVWEKIKMHRRIRLSGQNCFWEEKGAFTGEISPAMLIDAGCTYVIIGHSERRQFFGETDETVNRKIAAALRFGLKPIVCVGETLSERDGGKTFEVIERQITEGFKEILKSDFQKIVVAYEPVWAIGTGKTATPAQAEEVHSFIRSLLRREKGDEVAENTSILYGGSVTPDNVKAIMSESDIDGALVGGASLKPESFSRIVKFKEEGK